MTGRLLRRETVTIVATTSMFRIVTGGERDLQAVIAEAHAHGITGDHQYVAVTTPVEWNNRLPVEVQQWDGEPPDDLVDWEQGYAFGLQVGSGPVGILGWDGGDAWVQVPVGDYTARLYGRGLDMDDWAERGRPEDHWRLQLWPAGAGTSLPPARVKEWTPTPRPYAPPPEPPVEHAGPDPALARGLRMTRGFPEVPPDVVELLKPGVVWPGHPDYLGPG